MKRLTKRCKVCVSIMDFRRDEEFYHDVESLYHRKAVALQDTYQTQRENVTAS